MGPPFGKNTGSNIQGFAGTPASRGFLDTDNIDGTNAPPDFGPWTPDLSISMRGGDERPVMSIYSTLEGL